MKVKENLKLNKSIDFVLHEDNTISIVHSTAKESIWTITLAQVFLQRVKDSKLMNVTPGAYRMKYRFNLIRAQWEIHKL